MKKSYLFYFLKSWFFQTWKLRCDVGLNRGGLEVKTIIVNQSMTNTQRSSTQTRCMPAYWHHQWSWHTSHRFPHDMTAEMSVLDRSHSWSWRVHQEPSDRSHWGQHHRTACVAYLLAGLDSVHGTNTTSKYHYRCQMNTKNLKFG